MIAVFGAGALGSAIAHRLAGHARVDRILLVDDASSVAAGKALDIQQSCPITGSDVSLGSASDPLAAVGADAIVLADDAANNLWDRDRGLALVDRLMRSGYQGPFVFAGAPHSALMETLARELRVPGHRLIGSAAGAAASILASLVSIELGQSGASIPVAGRPPLFTAGWSAATIDGAPLTERIPAHRLLAMSQALSRLWPPGPEALAAPAGAVVEALVRGSRRLLTAATLLDGELGVRDRVGLLQLELGNGRVLRRLPPSLSPQERTEAVTAMLRN